MRLIIRWIGVAVLCVLSFVLGMLTCQRSEDEALAANSEMTNWRVYDQDTVGRYSDSRNA
jgi:hypothetical protein